MVQKELSIQSAKAIKDMESWYASLKDQYNCAQIAAAISTRYGHEGIIAMRLLFLNTRIIDNEFLSYQEIKFMKIYKSVDEGWKFIETLVKDGYIEVEGEKIDIEGDFRNIEQRDLHYNSSSIPHITKWPGKGYNYETRGGGQGPSGTLLKVGSPIYLYDDDAIKEWVGKKRDSHHTLFQHDVCVIFPDYSARIDSVKLHGENITISVELGNIEIEDIILKYYFSDEEKVNRDENLLSKSEITISLDFVPTII